MINIVTLMGRMVADAEVRQTNNGTPVASFRIAVERDTKSPDGQRQSDFINIVAWRQTAEFVQRYFHKGNMIALTGRIQTREYQDKDGNRRSAFEVVADRVSFTGEKTSDATPTYAPRNPAPISQHQAQTQQNRPAQAQQYANPAYQMPPQNAPRQDQWTDLTPDDGELPF